VITKEQLNELYDLAVQCGGRIIICFNKDETKSYTFWEGTGYLTSNLSVEKKDLGDFVEGLKKEASTKGKPFEVGITDGQEKRLFALAELFRRSWIHLAFDIGTIWKHRGVFRIWDDGCDECDSDSYADAYPIEWFDHFCWAVEEEARKTIDDWLDYE
jgi:hypothetical protein